jgi:hypothetical protein
MDRQRIINLFAAISTSLPYSMALIFALFLLVMVTREVRKAP